MEYYKFFSGSPKRRLEYFNQLSIETADAHDFMQTSKEWIGVVLSGEVGGSSTDRKQSYYPNEFEIVDLGDEIPRIEMKIRIFDREVYDLGLLDPTIQLADPFEKGINMKEKQWRISLHPSAYTLYNAFEQHSFNFGDTVSIREEDGCFFVTKNMSKPWPNAGTNVGLDMGLTQYDLSKTAVVSNGMNIKGTCDFEFQDYLDLYNTGVFDEITKEIARAESAGSAARFGGNIYDVYNYGGSTKRSGEKGILTVGGTKKEITQLTLSELMAAQRRGSKAVHNKYNVFAAGKYQIIPLTLRGIVKGIKDINIDTRLYNKDTQEVFGVYSFLSSRPVLGNFIMGGNVSVANAQVQVALEWASKRTIKQYKFKWFRYVNKKKEYFTQTCPIYCMCYGAGGNTYGHSGGNPTCNDKNNPSSPQYLPWMKRVAQRLTARLNRTRVLFDQSPYAREIRNRKCKAK